MQLSDPRAQVLVDRLARLPAFAEVSSGCREAIVEAAEMATTAPRERILRQGVPSPQLFVLLSGRAKMIRRASGGNRVVLGLFGPGEVVGATAALGNRPADASVEAIERCEWLAVSATELLDRIGSHREQLGELLTVITAPLVECNNCLVEAVSSRVEVRLAHLLCKLSEQIGRTENGGLLVPVRLTRQDLADMTGTRLETAIRIMSRWSKDGIVESRRDGFLVRDSKKLVGLSRERWPALAGPG